MNWYKIRVIWGAQGYTFVGSSSDSVEELIEKASRGEYLRLADLLYQEEGKIKDWEQWDNREIPTVYINPVNVVAIQAFKGDPRTLPNQDSLNSTRSRVDFDHIQLQGSSKFIARAQAVLGCLRTAPSHTQVWDLLVVLRQAKRSGVHAHKDLPVIDVGGFGDSNSTTIWDASGIAHEGFHIKLYREAKLRKGGCEPEPLAWVGVEAEKKCLEFQLLILQELNAKEAYLNYIRELMKSPSYQGDPFSRKDYLARDW